MDAVFPNTAEGIPRALTRGVTLLWANTVLFPVTHSTSSRCVGVAARASVD